MILFEVSGRPKAKGRPRTFVDKRDGKIRTLTPPETTAAEKRIRGNARPHAPAAPLEGPLRLEAVFVFRLPQKPGPGQVDGAPHTARPDADNLLKLVKDALVGLFYVDDSQVAELRARKVYGPADKTVISLSRLTTHRPDAGQQELS